MSYTTEVRKLYLKAALSIFMTLSLVIGANYAIWLGIKAVGAYYAEPHITKQKELEKRVSELETALRYNRVVDQGTLNASIALVSSECRTANDMTFVRLEPSIGAHERQLVSIRSRLQALKIRMDVSEDKDRDALKLRAALYQWKKFLDDDGDFQNTVYGNEAWIEKASKRILLIEKILGEHGASIIRNAEKGERNETAAVNNYQAIEALKKGK